MKGRGTVGWGCEYEIGFYNMGGIWVCINVDGKEFMKRGCSIEKRGNY